MGGAITRASGLRNAQTDTTATPKYAPMPDLSWNIRRRSAPWRITASNTAAVPTTMGRITNLLRKLGTCLHRVATRPRGVTALSAGYSNYPRAAYLHALGLKLPSWLKGPLPAPRRCSPDPYPALHLYCRPVLALFSRGLTFYSASPVRPIRDFLHGWELRRDTKPFYFKLLTQILVTESRIKILSRPAMELRLSPARLRADSECLPSWHSRCAGSGTRRRLKPWGSL